MPQNRPERPDFFARHRALLEQAVAATAHRGHWTPHPESPSKSLYGEDAAKEGEAAFHERLRIFRETVRAHGALTAAVHSTGEDVLAAAELAALDAGVHLSENLTGGVFVNQSAAFSDFDGSAANPAASATLSDPAFVTGRFATLRSRRPATAEKHTEESAHA
jgi:hypothetical protein